MEYKDSDENESHAPNLIEIIDEIFAFITNEIGADAASLYDIPDYYFDSIMVLSKRFISTARNDKTPLEMEPFIQPVNEMLQNICNSELNFFLIYVFLQVVNFIFHPYYPFEWHSIIASLLHHPGVLYHPPSQKIILSFLTYYVKQNQITLIDLIKNTKDIVAGLAIDSNLTLLHILTKFNIGAEDFKKVRKFLNSLYLLLFSNPLDDSQTVFFNYYMAFFSQMPFSPCCNHNSIYYNIISHFQAANIMDPRNAYKIILITIWTHFIFMGKDTTDIFASVIHQLGYIKTNKIDKLIHRTLDIIKGKIEVIKGFSELLLRHYQVVNYDTKKIIEQFCLREEIIPFLETENSRSYFYEMIFQILIENEEDDEKNDSFEPLFPILSTVCHQNSFVEFVKENHSDKMDEANMLLDKVCKKT